MHFVQFCGVLRDLAIQHYGILEKHSVVIALHGPLHVGHKRVVFSMQATRGSIQLKCERIATHVADPENGLGSQGTIVLGDQFTILITVGGKHFDTIFDNGLCNRISAGGHFPFIRDRDDFPGQTLRHLTLPLAYLFLYLLECCAAFYLRHGDVAYNRLFGRHNG